MSAAVQQILLLDDNADDALLFGAMLDRELGAKVQLHCCTTTTEANQLLADDRIDLCLVDYNLGRGGNGLEWAQQCYRQHGVMGPALIMLTGEPDTASVDAQAGDDDSGIADFLLKQEITAPVLERAIRYAGKQQRLLRTMKLREMRARIFFDYSREGIAILDDHGRITQANRAAETLFDYAHDTMIGLFLSQLVPAFSMKLFRPMGTDARPIISGQSIHQVSCFTHGGKKLALEMSLGIVYSENDSFYTASFLDISHHINKIEGMQLAASTDDLTGLLNRRYFRQRAEQELRRSKRHRTPVSMMMIDIDHFKVVNDTYGHPVGDIALQKVAKQLRQHLREHDLLCRWGGEEFLALMPESNLNAALMMGERIRTDIEALEIKEIPEGLTISIGIAEADPEQPLIQGIKHADKALYFAKQQGRNRVCCYTGK